jgi:hypothetical protein
MQLQPIDAAHFERDVVTDNVGDVGCHRNLLAEIPVMVLLTKDADPRTGPNIKRPQIGRALKVRRSGVGGIGPRSHHHAALEDGSYWSV